MPRQSNYDKYPYVPVGEQKDCAVGWAEIAARIRNARPSPRTVCVECYPGAFVDHIADGLVRELKPNRVVFSADAFRNERDIRDMQCAVLGDDAVFGRMNGITIADYFDPEKLNRLQASITDASAGVTLVIGTGASLVCPSWDLLVYADMARWEIQQRWRRNLIGNLGLDNTGDPIAPKYKCGYFLEWRAADRLKQTLLPQIDVLLDTNDAQMPKGISGEQLRHGLNTVSQRPFRVVPYFDPGPWGGHWMEEVCDLPRDKPNHAWCFDCVPEENSLLLGFGDVRVEVPSVNLVFACPDALLGEAVHGRFGKEFPIRFDFLDTMGGGNLSLQVHPLTEYIQDKFGMHYTQDESYYLLDAGQEATVYLGLKEDANASALENDLRVAQTGVSPFPAEKYVNQWPAKKHDHYLIPAGTIHCSGAESMVLEISATPYIFTFKLWDWGRLGMDGYPRPIHIDHGIANIQWDRKTAWIESNLVNQFESIASGDGWSEERTGLHAREFIETRRHWFTKSVRHDTRAGVNVLNLVEGDEVIVESPSGAFPPFIVHYAETFIVPAAVGAYTITPHGPAKDQPCATIKAFVRVGAD